MSISVTTDVFCDGDGCSLWTHGVTNGSRTAARHARREARRAGWKITKRGDFCPACATHQRAAPAMYEALKSIRPEDLSREGAGLWPQILAALSQAEGGEA